MLFFQQISTEFLPGIMVGLEYSSEQMKVLHTATFIQVGEMMINKQIKPGYVKLG